MDFNTKTICDNVHGSIGISKLEQDIINTRTFQRLKKIKQLGLASLVFPGAEHSRFAHSIGAMHVMSRMLDGLKAANCPHVCGNHGDEAKQKLRLAALLHDIGHFPLAHLGEQAFQWVDYVKNVRDVAEGGEQGDNMNLLQQAAMKYESEDAKHERFGELILTHAASDIKSKIEAGGLDPGEIARIINAEHKENPFFTQLMSSTLDCDRMDFLLRDSRASGTNYGGVDIDYIIANISWDDDAKHVCFKPKAKTAIEHFIMSRYFSYNLTYHKTVMGFELMAKALFYAMMRDNRGHDDEFGGIVSSLGEIKDRIDSDPAFLTNFTDEYFWHYLEHSERKGLGDELEKSLRRNLLYRIPLRPLLEERTVIGVDGEPKNKRYEYVIKSLMGDLKDSNTLKKPFAEAGVNLDFVVVVTRSIHFESIKNHRGYMDAEPTDEERLKLVKIKRHDGDGSQDLIDDRGSILNVLSSYQHKIARVYALVDKDSIGEKTLKEAIASRVDDHT